MSVAEDILEASILVVDDVPADARFVESILSAAGYSRITVVTDSRVVCDLHREHRYDLIVLDLVMPHRASYEVMAELATIEHGACLPVLAVTAEPEQLQRALRAGARDFVAKPIRTDELLARVRNLLKVQLALKALERRGEKPEKALDERTASLRESEVLFRLFAERLPEAVWIRAVKERVFRYVSPKLGVVLGVPIDAGDPIDKAIDCVHPEDRPRVLKEQQRLPQGGIDMEIRLVRPDGSERCGHARTFAIADSSGAVEWIGGILEDVTERRHMEAHLREAESRFRALVEQSIAGIYTVEDGVWTYVNPRLCELLDYPADELVGRAKIDFVVEEDRQRLGQNQKRVDEGERHARPATYRLRRKDGAIVHLSLDGKFIDADGRKILLGVAQDVTERVRAQELLHEAEEHYLTLVEQSLVGIYILENYRFIYANRTLQELTGFTLEELGGLEVKQLVHEQDHGRVDEIMKRRQAGETGSIAIYFRVWRKDGQLLHLRIESKLVELAKRKVALGIVQDVTEQTLAAEALRESEEKYRLLWETSTDAVILLEEGTRILYTNPAVREVFGYEASELEGRHVEVLFPARLRKTYLDVIDRYLQTGTRTLNWRAAEIKGVRRDGTEFPIEAAFSHLTLGGRSIFASFMRDVSERKKARAAMENANLRLQSLSDRVLTIQEEERRLLSSELHDDVGQSMLALQLGLHRLGQHSVQDKPQLLTECVGIVTAVQEKLRQLSVRLHPPQLGQLGLQDALRALVSRQQATTGLDIRSTIEGPEHGALPPQVEIACYRICQEALNNATRHSNARVIEVRTKLETDRFCMSVSDDGDGFDAGARGEAAHVAGNLGLVSMEERSRLAGGELELRTAPGAGTVVIAIFPRIPLGASAAVAAS